MIKSRVTLKQLEAFVFVVDLGSFRGAAAALATTQPNVSARIASLEATLDLVLMHRDAGSVRLTERGAALLPMARAALRSAEAFLEVADRKDLIEERLRLGVTELVACTWLHTFLRAFKEEYPNVSVELDVNLSREIERQLVSHQLDLALQTGPFTTQVSGTLALGRYPYAWVATPDLAEALSKRPALPALFRHSVLTHTRHATATSELLEAVKTAGLPEERIGFSSSLASCVPMAEDGMGIALLPRHIVRDALAEGQLVEIRCRWRPADLEVYARFEKIRAPGFVEFAANLAESVALKDQKK